MNIASKTPRSVVVTALIGHNPPEKITAIMYMDLLECYPMCQDLQIAVDSLVGVMTFNRTQFQSKC